MGVFTVKVTAKKLRRRKLFLRIASLICAISIGALLITFGTAHLNGSMGGFTVNIVGNNKKGISLSEEPNFESYSTYLKSNPVDNMNNITEEWLPDNLNDFDGSHNGEDYIAYSFYLKNFSNVGITYLSEINITNVTLNVDDAVRIKVYKNGSGETYAKRNKDLEPEPNTKPFYSNTKVINDDTNKLDVGKIDKYTIVIWLEGNDPECINDIKGGSLKLEMNFKILD